MSWHLVQQVGVLPLKPSEKLVLLCLAESASENDERRAWPGLEHLLKWSGVSRPQLFRLLSVLSELRLVEQVQRGQKGRRAVFVVLPDGCCSIHGPVVSGSHVHDPDETGEACG